MAPERTDCTQPATPQAQADCRQAQGGGSALRQQAGSVGYLEGSRMLSLKETEGISRFEGRTNLYSQPKVKGKPIRLERGTDLAIVNDAAAPGWVEAKVEGGPFTGKTGFVQKRYLEQQMAPADYAGKHATVNVVLFQGADNDPKRSSTDIAHRRYFVNVAKSLSSSRPNTVGCDLDSGKLLIGEPIEYNTGQDIVRALSIVGNAIAGKGKIGEVHILGHSINGIFGATHEKTEGLYTDASYDRMKANSQKFTATAPTAGVITRLPHAVGAHFEPTSAEWDVYPLAATRGLFDVSPDGKSPGAPVAFALSSWGEDGVGNVTAVHVAVGDRVTAGQAVLEITPRSGFTKNAAKLSELKPVITNRFAANAKIALHGCANSAGDNSFAEQLFDLARTALGAASKPEVAARPEVGDTRSHKVRVYNEKTPDGSKATRKAPTWFTKGL